MPWHALRVKRLVAMICLVWILVCAGNVLPCFAAETQAAPVSCCDPDATDSAPNADQEPSTPRPTCPCCPQLRPVVLVVAIPLSVPTEYQAPVTWSMDDQHVPPDPREILHVPKLAPSLG